MKLFLAILLTLLLAASCYAIGHRDGRRRPAMMINYAAGYSDGRQSVIRDLMQCDEASAVWLTHANRAVEL